MENKSTSNEKELLREVEKLSSQLIEAESQRSHFLSHVLNEINNPLTSILGLTKSIRGTQMRTSITRMRIIKV